MYPEVCFKETLRFCFQKFDMVLHRSTRSQRNEVVAQIDSPEAAVRALTSQPSFNTTVEETKSGMLNRHQKLFSTKKQK